MRGWQTTFTKVTTGIKILDGNFIHQLIETYSRHVLCPDLRITSISFFLRFHIENIPSNPLTHNSSNGTFKKE